MKVDFPIMTLSRKQEVSLSNCEYKMDLIDISLGKFGHLWLELFMLPRISIKIYKLGYLYFGLVLASGTVNFLVHIEGWNEAISAY